jgi:hypothetical protein
VKKLSVEIRRVVAGGLKTTVFRADGRDSRGSVDRVTVGLARRAFIGQNE